MNRVFVVLDVGPFRLGIDTDQVHKIYPLRRSSAEILIDWQAFKKEAGDAAGSIPLHSLIELLLGRKDDLEGQRRLIILAGETKMGIVVNQVGDEQDVAPEGIHPLPPAFSGICRSLFGQVALCGNLAVPVLTVDALPALFARDKKNRDGWLSQGSKK
ncbi:MAG: chemotaxis protein CheW [Desulfofustis sp.]|nr:chemotaxis protein CheW [Desulfofustis sp.]